MDEKVDASANQRFSSRLGLLLSALGIAVGTGNIWRFPRIAAQMGGEDGAGAFLIAWITFLFLWSIPLIIAEYALGRKHRKGVVGIFSRAMGRKFAWMGGFVAFVSTAIAFFYAVIVGWCMYYFFRMLFYPLPRDTGSSMAVWENFQQGAGPFLFHALALATGALAIWKGIRSIEKVNTILIPALLIIVLLSVIRTFTLPGAVEGIGYLFTPDWAQLRDPQTWLQALTQNAWDTGAGWGLFLTYAAYMKIEHGAVRNAFATGIGNNVISLMAGIMIFGTVFSVLQTELHMHDQQVLEVMKTSGPASTGLTFIWMPQLFSRMPLGGILSVLFFLGLGFAGFSSLIAMLELPVRVMLDAGMKRSRAILTVVGVVYLLGIPSAGHLGFLTNQDYVWGIALVISGAFIAAAVIRYGPGRFRREINDPHYDRSVGKWWEVVMGCFVPVAALVLLGWWLLLSATVFAPDDWFNPFNPFSVMTCLVQWFVVLGLLIRFNPGITSRLKCR